MKHFAFFFFNCKPWWRLKDHISWLLFLKNLEKKSLKTHSIEERFYATVWWISPRETGVCKCWHCIRWHLEVPSILNDFISLCDSIWGQNFFSTPVFFALTWTVSRRCCKIPWSDPEHCKIIRKHCILQYLKKKQWKELGSKKENSVKFEWEREALRLQLYCVYMDIRKIHIHLCRGWSC